MCSVSEDCHKLLLDMKHYHSSSDFGLYKDVQKSNRIIFWLKCILVLIGLSAVLIVIFHFTINAISEETESMIHRTTNETDLIEKSVSAPMGTQTLPTVQPKPFDVKFSGLHPHRFIPTIPTTLPTTLRAPKLKYPQLTNYRNNHYPQNIQDVIRFITDSPLASKYNNYGKRQVINTRRANGGMKTLGFVDPLQQYKPNDPSEINLLATGDFRFSPPAWKDFQRYNQVRQNTLQQHTIPSDMNQENINPTPPNVNLIGGFPGSMNMPQGPLRYNNQLKQNVFHHQVIPITKDHVENQNGNSYKLAPLNVNMEGSYSPNVHPNKIIDQQSSGNTNVDGIFKKPFMVTLSVFPETSQNMEMKPPVPDFRLLQDETWRNFVPDGSTGMHLFMKVFPSVSYPAV